MRVKCRHALSGTAFLPDHPGQQSLADSFQALRGYLVGSIGAGVPVRVIEINDVHRGDTGLDEWDVIVQDAVLWDRNKDMLETQCGRLRPYLCN